MLCLFYCVVSNPHGLQPSRFLCPWEFSRQEYWSRLPCPQGFPIPGIKPRSPTLQADSLPSEPPRTPKNTGVGRLSLSRGSSQHRNWTRVSCIANGFFTSWATREALHLTTRFRIHIHTSEQRFSLIIDLITVWLCAWWSCCFVCYYHISWRILSLCSSIMVMEWDAST